MITLNLKNEEGGKKTAEVLIYESIGQDFFSQGLTAKSFVKDLGALGDLDEINLRINSPGGSVFDADAIYNALVRNKARVVVDIDGLAASAASYIAMAGDEIRIAENGHFMIHLSWGGAMGNKEDMRAIANVLDMLDNSIANIYAKRTGGKKEDFLALMAAETWMDAATALKHGLANSITPAKEIAACIGPNCPFAHAPKQYLQGEVSPSPIVAILERFKVSIPAASVKSGLKVKGKTMSKQNGRCGCNAASNAVCPECGSEQVIETESGYACEACGATWADDKAGYAALMNAAIDAAVTEDRTKDAILQELADAAGMDMEGVNALLSDEGDCPTQAHVDAFATVEGMPTAEEQKTAAEGDGCTFEESTPEEPVSDPVEAKLKQLATDAIEARLAEIASHA